MDDACNTEELRALAFASIPSTSRKSHCWVRGNNDREEGELSSDGEAELSEFATACLGIAQPRKSRRSRNRKKQAVFQSVAPFHYLPINIPQVSTSSNAAQVFRGHAPLAIATRYQGISTGSSLIKARAGTTVQNTVRAPIYVQDRSGPPGLAATSTTTTTLPLTPNTVQLQGTVKGKTPTSTGVSMQKAVQANTNRMPALPSSMPVEARENPFLIKFCDDDSESDGEQLPNSVLALAGKAITASAAPVVPKPANLSVEIKRMKKQIAAIERVKGKSLPISKGTKPSKMASSNPIRSNALDGVTKLNPNCGSNLDTLRQQIASKESELQQERQRKGPSSFAVPVLPTTKPGAPVQSDAGPPKAVVSGPLSDGTGVKPKPTGTLKRFSMEADEPRMFKYQKTQRCSLLTEKEPSGFPPNRMKNGIEHMHNDAYQQDTRTTEGSKKTKMATDMASQIVVFSDTNSRQGVIDKNLSSDAPPNFLPSHTGLNERAYSEAPVTVFTEPIVQTTAAGTTGSTADDWHQSLKQLEMEEEALDKGLEEAQQLRHRCEIRERIARKAYREAQEALRLANMQCDKLHQKREILALRVKAAEIRNYSSKSFLEEAFICESQPFPALAANNPGSLRTLKDDSLQAVTVSSPILNDKNLAVDHVLCSNGSAGTDDREDTVSERFRHEAVLESCERTDKTQAEAHILPGPYIDLGVVEQAENGDDATKNRDSILESSMHPEIRTSGDELEQARSNSAYQNMSADIEGTAAARKESWLTEPTGVVCIDPQVNVFEKDCANFAGTIETTTEDSTGYCNHSAAAAVALHEHLSEVCNSEFLNKDAGAKVQGSPPCIEEEDLQDSSSSDYAAGREVTSEKDMDSNTHGSGKPLARESIADMGDPLSLQQAQPGSHVNMEVVMQQETLVNEADKGSLEEFIDLGNDLHDGDVTDGYAQEKETQGLSRSKKLRPSQMSAGRLVVFRQVPFKREGVGIHVLHEKRSSEISGRVPAVCGDYESPLKNFRSYRICPRFSLVFGLSEESSTWSHAINPFKPLCKYEHRGKCNNDLCTFQHVNQYKLESGQISQDLQLYRLTDAAEQEEVNVSNAFKKIRPSLCQWKWTDHPVQVPTYRIGTYLMRSWEDMHPMLPDSVQSGTCGSDFYGFLSSVSTQRPLPNDMPCLLDTLNKGLCSEMDSPGFDEPRSSSRVEGSNDRHPNAEDQLVFRDSGDVDSCLDIALNILQYDINLKNTNCLKNALYVLSRALEVKQNSVSLWVVYLILFYKQDTDTKKDDMFLHAVQRNKFSYELWCLVLNSRSNLGAQLETYELAILAMCERGTQDRQVSACILDFTLRMLYCMAMSESTGVLVSWMEDLVADSSQDGNVCSRRKSTLAVLRHLLPCDACVLWVSCAYLSAYGSLPKDVIARLGCKQDLPICVEWEICSMASEDSRCRVMKLMKCAASSGIGCLQLSSAAALVGALPRQALAVNFVKCLAAFEGLGYAATHGQHLMQLHPASLELIVLCANIERQRSDCKAGLGVFQNAISNWPNEKPGIQLLWNQYAGHALEWEGDESAIAVLEKCAASTRELSHLPCTSDSRFFNEQHQNRLEEVRCALKSLSSVGYVKTENSEVSSVQDLTFSLLNLALFEVLCGNTEDAQQALERALSSNQDVTHCWQEYAAYRLFSSLGTSGSQDFLKFQQAFISFLDRCYIHSQLSSTLIPLGREFLKGIKKRRIRCFINNLVGPAPQDHSFINSLLEASFGPELLATHPPDLKNFEQFAGGLLEICPANAPLALAFCKAVRNSLKGPDSVATSGWAASLLINSLRLSFPVASEAYWLEAGDLLEQFGLEDCCPGFYCQALAVYPFSVGLWRCYISHCRRCGNEEAAILAAKGRGLPF